MKIRSFCCGILKFLSYSTISLLVLILSFLVYLKISHTKQDNDEVGLESLIDLEKDVTWEDNWRYVSVPLNIEGADKDASLNVLERVNKKLEKDAPLVVLLHGHPESALLSWSEVIPLLDESFHVIAIDQRGYNNSYSPSSVKDYLIDHLVNDVLITINHFKGENVNRKVYIASHDWGAIIGWRCAQLSKLVDKVVIINVPHPKVFLSTIRSSWTQFKKSWYVFFYQIPYLPEFLLSLIQDNDMKKGLASTSTPMAMGGKYLSRLIEHLKRTASTQINWYRSIVRHSTIRELFDKDLFSEKVSIPTLVLWGKKDRFLDERMARESMNYVENGKIKLFDDNTHWIIHEIPVVIAKELNWFFKN